MSYDEEASIHLLPTDLTRRSIGDALGLCLLARGSKPVSVCLLTGGDGAGLTASHSPSSISPLLIRRYTHLYNVYDIHCHSTGSTSWLRTFSEYVVESEGMNARVSPCRFRSLLLLITVLAALRLGSVSYDAEGEQPIIDFAPRC